MPAARVVAFGEVLLRLSAPLPEPLLASGRLDTCFGGAEANVAVALAQLGTPAKLATVLPDNPLGAAALAEFRRHGVDIGAVTIGPGRLGLYFLAPGAGPRGSVVTYDRAGSAFADIAPDAIDWAHVLAGAEWLHVSGITLAVSERAEAAAVSAIAAARQAGCKVSFDCNYRAGLWTGRGADAGAAMARVIAEADLVFADHRDYALLGGAPIAISDPCERQQAIADAFFAHFSGLASVAHVTREVSSHERHCLTGHLSMRDGDRVASRPWQLDAIVDRIGGGDAFAAGILHGFLNGWAPVETIAFAIAAGALKHTLPGDAFTLDERAVRSAIGGAADVAR